MYLSTLFNFVRKTTIFLVIVSFYTLSIAIDKVVIVPCLVAIVYLSTFVRYSDFVTFSDIPQASHFIRLFSI